MPESHPIPAMTAAAQAAACSSATIDGVFRRAFTVFADRVAVVAEDKSMTYAELRRRAWQLANALTALGLGRGSRIAVLRRRDLCRLRRTRRDGRRAQHPAASRGAAPLFGQGQTLRADLLRLAHAAGRFAARPHPLP